MKSLQIKLKTLCTVLTLFVAAALPAYGAALEQGPVQERRSDPIQLPSRFQQSG